MSALILVGSSVKGANGSTIPCASLSTPETSLELVDCLRPLECVRLRLLLPLPLVCQPSCPKLPLLISPTVGALEVAAAVAAKKPRGGSRRRTRSSVKLIADCEADATLCATLEAVFVLRLLLLKLPSVGDEGAAIEPEEIVCSSRCSIHESTETQLKTQFVMKD